MSALSLPLSIRNKSLNKDVSDMLFISLLSSVRSVLKMSVSIKESDFLCSLHRYSCLSQKCFLQNSLKFVVSASYTSHGRLWSLFALICKVISYSCTFKFPIRVKFILGWVFSKSTDGQ